ncbi:MAG: stage II sporulation protein R [Clostridia bacterium]|jgi:stage II sporulation protein R|nr:stage II sporulation protein R [Clostridia bacterium]
MSKKSIIIIIFLFLIYFIFYSISYSYSISQELEENVFRLHIIANSDSVEDQELKLYVRDKVIEYLHQFSFSSKQDLINFLNENKTEIENVVQKSINEKGYSYPFSLEISNSFFPKKEYGNIELPSGIYDGLRIKIGDSNR